MSWIDVLIELCESCAPERPDNSNRVLTWKGELVKYFDMCCGLGLVSLFVITTLLIFELLSLKYYLLKLSTRNSLITYAEGGTGHPK